MNRIDLEGNVVSDAQDYQRQEAIMRILEKEWSLTTVPMSQSTARKAPTKGEVEQVLRTGESSYRMKLQQIIDTALTQPCTLSSFTQKLEQAHVAVRINTAKTGFISGISFSMDGVAFKGSSLGHQYTWSNLKKEACTMSKIDTLMNMNAEVSQAVLQEVDDSTLLQARIAILNKQEEVKLKNTQQVITLLKDLQDFIKSSVDDVRRAANFGGSLGYHTAASRISLQSFPSMPLFRLRKFFRWRLPRSCSEWKEK